MQKMILSVVTAVALLPLVVGCSQNSQVVRGQSPADPAVVYQDGAYDDCDDDCDDDDHCRRCHKHRCHCHCHCRPYCVPSDLVYPPPGDVPGIVQYPYYTCKGPDCFFLQ